MGVSAKICRRELLAVTLSRMNRNVTGPVTLMVSTLFKNKQEYHELSGTVTVLGVSRVS